MGRGTIDRENTDREFVRYLERDFDDIKFVWGAKRFSYHSKKGLPTVFLGSSCQNFALLALHELGHALCKHKDYSLDVSRVKIESEAWERAKMVYLNYQEKAKSGEVLNNGSIKGTEVDLAEILPMWDEDFVQEKLDTYRDWLHLRSKCKKCGLTRYQTEDGEYHCPRCENFLN